MKKLVAMILVVLMALSLFAPAMADPMEIAGVEVNQSGCPRTSLLPTPRLPTSWGHCLGVKSAHVACLCNAVLL